ncbi:zinc finger protein 287-like isoform X2 [Thalassophryne amazonica]|uniref:zinc finger protein 287-like isoform X2 n=1 Tax=Thalassophryne amazonica TaxID=390379 RepID=UPI001471325A|nr:zinc finger protein 287-like isoform X2 [Thalassophryne amazonica]
MSSRKVLNVVTRDEVTPRREDLQFLVGKDVVPVEQQDWNFSVDQEEPGGLHIKEEHEEFPLTGVPVKNGGSEEKPQSSHLHHTEENREVDPRTSSSIEHMKIEEEGPEADKCLRQDIDDEGSREDPQQFSVGKDVVPVEQQDWNFIVDQEDPDALHIKEEHDEFSLTGVPGKNVGDKEKPQSSHLRHTEENREDDPRTSGSTEYLKMEEDDPEEDTCLRQDTDDEGSREDLQQFSVGKDVVPVEQQDWNFSVDQEEPDGLHIKEEHEEFSLTGVPVKNGGDKEKPQSSHLHHREENREAELRISSSVEHMRTDVEGRESDTCLRQDTNDECSREGESDDSNSSDFWKETRERQSGLKTMKRNQGFDTDSEAEDKPFPCSDCGSSFHSIRSLNRHKAVHGREPCSCPVCGKSFVYRGSLTQHMLGHTDLKSICCGKCNQRFTSLQLSHHQCAGLQVHGDNDSARLSHRARMLVRGGDVTNFLRYSCSHCGKHFERKHTMIVHQRVHTRGKPFRCSFCPRRFGRLVNMKQHMRIHQRKKPFAGQTPSLPNRVFTAPIEPHTDNQQDSHLFLVSECMTK